MRFASPSELCRVGAEEAVFRGLNEILLRFNMQCIEGALDAKPFGMTPEALQRDAAEWCRKTNRVPGIHVVDSSVPGSAELPTLLILATVEDVGIRTTLELCEMTTIARNGTSRYVPTWTHRNVMATHFLPGVLDCAMYEFLARWAAFAPGEFGSVLLYDEIERMHGQAG